MIALQKSTVPLKKDGYMPKAPATVPRTENRY